MDYTDIQKDREQYNISQTKLAEFSGYSKSKISSWELQKDYPTEHELSHLREVLNELIPKIVSGELNLKGHRVVKQ